MGTGIVKSVANNAPVVANEKNIRAAEMGGNKFGPWMVVSRKGKTRNYAGKNFSHGTVEEHPNGQPSNSRFVVLASQDPGDNEHEYVATDTQGKETSHADPKQPHKNYVLQPHASEFKRRHSTRFPSKFTDKGKSLIAAKDTRNSKIAMHPKTNTQNHVVNPNVATTSAMPLDTQPSPMMIPHHAPTTLDPLMHTTISVHNPNNKLIDTHELDGDTIQMSREIKGRSLPFLGDPPDLHGGDTNLEMEADSNYVEDEDDAKTTAGEDSFVKDTQMNTEDRIHGSSHNGLESWVTAVYASPIPTIRRELWYHLASIASQMSDLWMLDLNFSGPHFTWSRGNLSKRLDKAVCNDGWLIKHANSSVMHLPKIDSDHRPILVKLQNMDSRHGGPRPFQFLAAWLTDERFGSFVNGSWNFLEAVADFTQQTRRWNKDIFENIIYRKRKLLARIGGIQRILETKPNHSLTRLEVKLQKELEEWIHDVEIIKQLAVRFFSDLYTPEQGVHNTYNVRGYFPVMSDDFCLSLMSPVTDEEIRRTVFSMSPFKAPGVDGFHAGFYQAQWNTVGMSLSSSIKNIFTSNHIPAEINRTLLVLIPKVDHPTSLKMFRPISLCMVPYKTVTKIITNRLQAFLPNLIGPQQTSFVPGRHITENIVIAQEETLQEVGLPKQFIQLIMGCLSTAQMNVLWNGEMTEVFRPGRGIRQRDPLSPYIFVLCIERLSHGIIQAVNQGRWKPIRLTRIGTPLSHLFFADDLLLFLEASYGQVAVLNDVVENFCRSSDAKVSNQKTQVFFSKIVPVTLTSGIGKALGLSVTNNLGRYLGMPLLHDRVSKKTYQSIIDNIDQWLSGWAAKHLSLVGRVTLAQSVLQAILIYAMQTTYLPSSVRIKIDQLCRRFIWSGAGSQRKLSLVSWDNIYRPKSNGGLGFKDMDLMNKALLMKVAWDLFINPSKLCSQIWKDFQRGLQWSIGNGQRVKFWDDIWATNGDPLTNYTVTSIPNSMRNMLVADCVDQNGNWLWNKFSFCLNNHVVLRIASMAPPSAMQGDDRVYWGASNTGIFTVHSAYRVLTNFGPAEDYVESFLHAIRDCVYSRGIWRKLVPAPRQHDFFSYPLRQWIMTNLRRRACDMGSLFWPVMFGIAAWRIWYWRNQRRLSKKCKDSEMDSLGSSPMAFLMLEYGWCKERKLRGECSANLGVCSVIKAELWGVLHGLRMAWDLGYRRIQVGTDNCSVVQLIKENNANVTEFSNIIEMIKELIRRD
ncbi:uncharacterized protein LOC112099143 [Citrus clementina]|uniref:uncharacterized protein LOC112099143 n=1 Tax=Citrus clementina TaxID=85681 RepID=UPI000CECF6D8|nr:uncharacterized protein LOC112099143 [Citrus x clementina]